MKVLVVGASGTIGKALADTLAERHDVVRASRKGDPSVDIQVRQSLAALFEKVTKIDAVVTCAGEVMGSFGPLDQLTEAQFQIGIRWMMGTAHLVQLAQRHVRDGGSITVTTGALVRHPRAGASVGIMGAAGIEGFVRAAALEMPRGLRINAVSPGWVKETMEQRGMDSNPGMPARTLAAYYARAIEGSMNGAIIDAMSALPM